MSYKRSEKVELKPMTVRFSTDDWDTIESLARKNGINKTELVRIALAGNLARYLGTIRIINDKQATEIKELIKALLDEVSAVKIELHRIGVNYNQSIRLKQIERKYANSKSDVTAMLRKFDEEKAVKSECKDFSKDDLDALISRYEKATKQVGDMLCRILT